MSIKTIDDLIGSLCPLALAQFDLALATRQEFYCEMSDDEQWARDGLCDILKLRVKVLRRALDLCGTDGWQDFSRQVGVDPLVALPFASGQEVDHVDG